MSKILIVLLSIVLLAGAALLFSKENVLKVDVGKETREQKQTQAFKAPAPKKEPMLVLSTNQTEQSDTLVARVEGVPAGTVPEGMFLSRQVSFFEAGDSWLAIVGVGAKREPGTYVFEVQVGKETRVGEIQVAKRAFPITKLVVTEELEDKGYTPTKIAKNIAAVENNALQEALVKYTPAFYGDQKFAYPLGTIDVVGDYGNIRQSNDIFLQHLGVDLDAKMGSPVYAVNDGFVVLQRDFVNYGRTLVIDHGFGIYSLYLHLDKMLAEPGDFVNREQVIARSGNTGYSIAPHLHFSVKVAGESVDPLRFIKTVNRELPFLAR